MSLSATFLQSNLLYDQERLSMYRAGGYHPVNLNDAFKDGRYKVIHKLGWGGFSTVWLARDNLLQEWVALKIGTANNKAPSSEQAILQSLQRQSALHYSAQYIDSFVHRGPNGDHQCLVTDLLGPSIDAVVADYNMAGDRLEPETILRVSKQLLQAIAFAHRAGYAHGDVSGCNVVFTASKLRTLSEEALFDIIGYPEATSLARVDGSPLDRALPNQLVRSICWTDWTDEDDEEIRLIDWGESFKLGTPPSRLSQPGDLQAPEIIFTGSFDHRLDLWRAGCTIYSLLFAARPFQYLGDLDVLVLQMIGFVEDLPKEWQKAWEMIQQNSGRKLRTDYSSTRGTSSCYKSKLELRFDEMVEEPKLTALLPVIQGLIRFLPSTRISAEEALRLL